MDDCFKSIIWYFFKAFSAKGRKGKHERSWMGNPLKRP